MARALNGEASLEEKKELGQLLLNDPTLQQQYEHLRHLWEMPAGAETETPEAAEQQQVARILQLARVQEVMAAGEEQEPQQERRHSRRWIWLAAGAVCLLALVLALVWLTRQPASSPSMVVHKEPMQVITAQNGSRMQLKLPDGSTVWLNAGSSISYARDFEGAARAVKLEGEAYFDVAKNPRKPFIVQVAGIDIKVLGTAFDVKAYASDKTIETTLIHGLVQVSRQGDSGMHPVLLHPNEKLVLHKQAATNPAGKLFSDNTAAIPQHDSIAAPTDVNIMHLSGNPGPDGLIETAWLYNRLAFRGDSFETLAQKMERWYNIDVEFSDEQVKKLSFNGSFEKETVEQAFIALQAAVPFRFTLDGHRVVVSSAGK